VLFVFICVRVELLLQKIPLSEPWLTPLEIAAVQETVASGWLSTAAPVVDLFESRFIEKFGFASGLATHCGTSALWMALVTSHIGVTHEVIVPALTFAATVNPVCYVGATPVFADVEPETFGISPKTVEPLITARTKAIIATHLYGFACDIEGLRQLADAYNLLLIEDAAEALGTTINQKHVGHWGDFAAFSFNGNKTLTTGSGGMLVSAYTEKMAVIKQLSTQAKRWHAGELEHFAVGYNTRMSALPAALGVAQLQRFDSLLNKRIEIAKQYEEALPLFFRGTPPAFESGSIQEPSYWLSTVRLPDPNNRLQLLALLAEVGIEARPIFKPLPLTQAYHAYAPNTLFPISTQLWQSHINLPSSGTLTPEQQAFVIKALKQHW
jgi:perosamine synthetase